MAHDEPRHRHLGSRNSCLSLGNPAWQRQRPGADDLHPIALAIDAELAQIVTSIDSESRIGVRDRAVLLLG